MPRLKIPLSLRSEVVQRANGLCEYCLIHQDDTETNHQIDQLVAVKHGGQTVSQNLALACQLCNRHKGTDLTGIDPETSAIVELFNPRTQMWSDHFELESALIVGRSATGRATVSVLRLNGDARLIDRQVLAATGRYPARLEDKGSPS